MHNHSTNLFPEDEESEMQTNPQTSETVQRGSTARESLVKKLSFLDRFLALWIFLAMVLGILLGCFVPGTQDVLNTAKLIGVSAPIGTHS
jgi:arsenite transporter